jgi:hypothetical protein
MKGPTCFNSSLTTFLQIVLEFRTKNDITIETWNRSTPIRLPDPATTSFSSSHNSRHSRRNIWRGRIERGSKIGVNQRLNTTCPCQIETRISMASWYADDLGLIYLDCINYPTPWKSFIVRGDEDSFEMPTTTDSTRRGRWRYRRIWPCRR